MIIARAPLRMSFAGGGSDIPSFYREHGGALVNVSIDKAVYVSVNNKFDDNIRFSYSKTENVERVDQLEHQYAKEILKYLEITGGVEMTSMADIPGQGSGLGSSSSFSVAMLHALHAYKQEYVSPEDLAQQACMIEIEKCAQPIGKQDQYAAAYGGLNFMEFRQDETVVVNPIICRKETKEKLEKNLLMLYTGTTRSASNILQEQSKNMWENSDKTLIMKRMVELAHEMKKELENNNVDAFGTILHENRMLKKEMASGISNPVIDDRYQKGLDAGATGWKILWAGWWGFLLFYAPQEKHEDILKAIPELKKIPFQFENKGSQIIFYY